MYPSLLGHHCSIIKHGSIFPDYPENIIDFGLHNKVPVMAGTNTAEGAMSSGIPNWWKDWMMRMFGKQKVLVESCSEHLHLPERIGNHAMISWFYFNGTFAASKLQNYVDMISDSSIIRTTHQTLMKLASSGSMNGIKLYEYVLSFQDETSITYSIWAGCRCSSRQWFVFPFLCLWCRKLVTSKYWNIKKNLRHVGKLC